jgi:hypothetical protein
MSNFLVILIAILAFLAGLFKNYGRWRVSGRLYRIAADRNKAFHELTEKYTMSELALKLAKRENLKLVAENERLKQGIIKCK